MTETTPLDAAHEAMEAVPQDDAARLRFYDRLAATEMFVLLTREPEGEVVEPEIFDLGEAKVVLVFDREERLSAFTGRISPYAALPGRAVVRMLAGQGIGLGVNLEVAPSSLLLPAEAVDWLAGTLDHGPEESEARVSELRPPSGLPQVLLEALDARLASAAGLAACAWLAAAVYEDKSRGHLLGIAEPVPGSEDALARAINEALVFSGLDAGALDVVFLRRSDPMAARLARVGLRFDLPEAPQAEAVERPAPGSDPDKPPILR